MVILIILAVVLLGAFLVLHSKHKSPAKAAIANMVLGAASLVLIAPLVSAAVNLYTVFTALTLGLPGTLLVALGTVLLS